MVKERSGGVMERREEWRSDGEARVDIYI